MTRIVPQIPAPGVRLPVFIDTDAANEIDDLYAVALALAAPDCIDLRGLVASHFAAKAGLESIDQSYDVLVELLNRAGMTGRYPLEKGSHPMRYPNHAEPSRGVDLLIETARSCTPEHPLWVVCLGAATDLASAMLLAPDIRDRVRYLYHGRSENTWPWRTTQFNIYGDIIATKTLLESDVPLAWFDTGTHLCADMNTTEAHLAGSGDLGRFLHDYRNRVPWYAASSKGFFDIGDIAWLIDPTLFTNTVVNAPGMTRWMEFVPTTKFGQMLHIGKMDVPKTWALFFDRVRQAFGNTYR